MLRVFNNDDQEIAFGFTNCGWIMTPYSLLTSIQETMEDIRLYNDGKYYSHQDDWINNVAYITTYGIKIFKNELAVILLGKEEESEALIEVMMNETSTN